MPEFKTFKELEDFIKVAIKNSLEKEVFETVREEEQRHIGKDVYSKYAPRMYKRRYDDGGLIADENIVGKMISGDILQVTNDTLANHFGNPPEQVTIEGKNLSELVEFGDGASGSYDFPTEDGEFLEPRPFTENTIEDLKNSNKHKIALQSGLKRQGIDSN